MKIVVFDTETTSIEKPFAYNIGYKIYDIIDKRKFLTVKYWIFTVIMVAIILVTPIITYGLI